MQCSIFILKTVSHSHQMPHCRRSRSGMIAFSIILSILSLLCVCCLILKKLKKKIMVAKNVSTSGKCKNTTHAMNSAPQNNSTALKCITFKVK